jgi:hypothetical protein
MAFTFPLNGKYVGNFDFEENQYSYILYFLPLSIKHKREVIHYFGNRKLEDGSTCLDVDIDTITDYIKNAQISVFCIVYSSEFNDVNNPNADIASGTIQIYNHLDEGTDIEDTQCWINDVCRSRNYDIKKQIVSPIKALFYLFEQLTISLLHKQDIYLMIEYNIENEDKDKNRQIKKTSKKLEEIYTNYGFNFMGRKKIGVINYKIMSKQIINKTLDFSSVNRARGVSLSSRSKRNKGVKNNKTKKTRSK